MVKLHIRNRLFESFPTIFRTWWCGEEKLHFTPVHTLRQLKRDEALFSPLPRVVEFRARYRQIPVRGFSRGQAKFGDRATYGLGAISVCTRTHTCTHTRTHTPAHKAINIISIDNNNDNNNNNNNNKNNNNNDNNSKNNGLDRVGCLVLILGLYTCVDDLESK